MAKGFQGSGGHEAGQVAEFALGEQSAARLADVQLLLRKQAAGAAQAIEDDRARVSAESLARRHARFERLGERERLVDRLGQRRSGYPLVLDVRKTADDTPLDVAEQQYAVRFALRDLEHALVRIQTFVGARDAARRNEVWIRLEPLELGSRLAQVFDALGIADLAEHGFAVHDVLLDERMMEIGEGADPEQVADARFDLRDRASCRHGRDRTHGLLALGTPVVERRRHVLRCAQLALVALRLAKVSLDETQQGEDLLVLLLALDLADPQHEVCAQLELADPQREQPLFVEIADAHGQEHPFREVDVAETHVLRRALGGLAERAVVHDDLPFGIVILARGEHRDLVVREGVRPAAHLHVGQAVAVRTLERIVEKRQGHEKSLRFNP